MGVGGDCVRWVCVCAHRQLAGKHTGENGREGWVGGDGEGGCTIGLARVCRVHCSTGGGWGGQGGYSAVNEGRGRMSEEIWLSFAVAQVTEQGRGGESHSISPMYIYGYLFCFTRSRTNQKGGRGGGAVGWRVASGAASSQRAANWVAGSFVCPPKLNPKAKIKYNIETSKKKRRLEMTIPFFCFCFGYTSMQQKQ